MPQESSVSPFRALRAASPTDRNRTEARLDRRAASPLVNVCRRDIILVPPTIHQATKRSKPRAALRCSHLSAFPYIGIDLGCLRSRSVRLGRVVARRVGEELRAAACAAEIVGGVAHLSGMARPRDRDTHAAHGVDSLACRFAGWGAFRLRLGAPS